MEYITYNALLIRACSVLTYNQPIICILNESSYYFMYDPMKGN